MPIPDKTITTEEKILEELKKIKVNLLIIILALGLIWGALEHHV